MQYIICKNIGNIENINIFKGRRNLFKVLFKFYFVNDINKNLNLYKYPRYRYKFLKYNFNISLPDRCLFRLHRHKFATHP